MGNTSWDQLVFILICALCCHLVESRHCIYITADGNAHTIFCSAYEYCCGNGCCRPTVFKFYQFWYFWLSVILIMLLCSGGSWWYRYKYRTQLLSQRSPFTHITTTTISQQRPTPGALYYPSAERVHLQAVPKDASFYPYMKVNLPPTVPPYNMASGPANEYSYQTSYPPYGSAMGMPSAMPPHPPPYSGPPPSYDCVVQPIPATVNYPLSPNPPANSGIGFQQFQNYPMPQTNTPLSPLPGQEANLRNRSNEPPPS